LEKWPLQDSDFNDLVDQLVEQLEDQLDEIDADLDIDASGGLLRIGFPDHSAIILSRQLPLHEIWIAAVSGGFHLACTESGFYCKTTEETLAQLLSRTVS